MSRIGKTFDALAARGRKALVPYLMAGDPHADATVPILHAMVGAGADLIELGMPFSDPMADGPVVQKAGERALARGVGLAEVLAMVREFRLGDDRTPVVVMGYANPVERYGVERFVADAKSAGIDGVLVVDYPPEECAEFADRLRAAAIDPIFLIAPTSSDERIARVAEAARGYVYHVSLKGVTGAGHFDLGAVREMIPRIRKHVRVPIGVGFGIRDGATARAVAEVADAVVIGSALVQLLEGAGRDDAPRIAAEFIGGVRAALDAPSARAAHEQGGSR
jgi:tryptophan synthase alpha chain